MKMKRKASKISIYFSFEQKEKSSSIKENNTKAEN